MKVFYIANIRTPTEKAHGLQTMKMCEAFALHGDIVELVVPDLKNVNNEDIFAYYSVKRIFSIRKAFTFSLFGLGSFGFYIRSIVFYFGSIFSTRVGREDVVYTRDMLPTILFSLIGKTVAYEIHDIRKSVPQYLSLRLAKKVIVISNGLKEVCLSKGVSLDKILVAPDAFDPADFDINLSKGECRQGLGLPLQGKVVLYSGHLYGWKGAHILAEASVGLPGASFIFIGGTSYDVIAFKKSYGDFKNVSIFGMKPHKEVPLYLKAADVLVIPNSGKSDIGRLYTSPMKLFEYMASGTPIVASDLPAMREILNENNSFFFKADDSADLVISLKKVLENLELAKRVSKRALEDVKAFTWTKRVENIINFIND